MSKINLSILSPEEVLERSGVEGLKKSMEILSNENAKCIISLVDGKLEWGFGERGEDKMTCPKCGTEIKPSPDNPWCEACEEKDCLIGGDDYCEMIRVYKKRKEALKDINF